MAKFTPGPWEVGPEAGSGYVELPSDCQLAIRGGEDQLILACVISDCVAEHEANANLIAAAPEMYAELKRIYEKEGWTRTGEVIAKAEGRK